MSKDPLDFDGMKALAAELLRLHRSDDRIGFQQALRRAEGQVPALVISMSGIANRAMDEVIGRDEATALVERIAQDLPADPHPTLAVGDAWLDGVALVRAVVTDDEEGARVLVSNSPDPIMLFGAVVQLVAILLQAVPRDQLLGLLDAAREEGPPDNF